MRLAWALPRATPHRLPGAETSGVASFRCRAEGARPGGGYRVTTLLTHCRQEVIKRERARVFDQPRAGASRGSHLKNQFAQRVLTPMYIDAHMEILQLPQPRT